MGDDDEPLSILYSLPGKENWRKDNRITRNCRRVKLSNQ